jgi:hypothetical protein
MCRWDTQIRLFVLESFKVLPTEQHKVESFVTCPVHTSIYDAQQNSNDLDRFFSQKESPGNQSGLAKEAVEQQGGLYLNRNKSKWQSTFCWTPPTESAFRSLVNDPVLLNCIYL